MSALFLSILNLAINASWLIFAVIAARLLLKRAPKWISCLLWGLVAVRLLCPVSLESALSLLPSGKVVPENIEMVRDPHIVSGMRLIDDAVNPVIEKAFSPEASASVNPMQIVIFTAGVIWLAGMAAMLLYALISYIILKRKVRAAVTVSGRVRKCDEVDSPFILGIFRPAIYVPSGIDETTLALVTAHEEAHLKRHDHWWKPLGFLLLSVYWFNPLCWVAYILFCRDIEAACDEKVIRDKDRAYVAAYSQALLDCSVQRRIIAACPLAFGEAGVKERVKGVLHYKKPAFWVIIVSVIVCIVIAVCFLTNPPKKINLPDDPVVFAVYDNPDGYVEFHWEENPVGISMTATEVTPTGCMLKLLQAGGNVTGQLQTGQWYELQVKNGDGDWIDHSARDIARAWEDIAYIIEKDGATELTVNWQQDYGYLQDGHYRIVKQVMDYRNPGDYDEYEVYAEFNVESGTASASMKSN